MFWRVAFVIAFVGWIIALIAWRAALRGWGRAQGDVEMLLAQVTRLLDLLRDPWVGNGGVEVTRIVRQEKKEEAE